MSDFSRKSVGILPSVAVRKWRLDRHLLLGTAAIALLSAPAAHANPLGGTVTTGSATISSPSSKTTSIKQTSEGVVIDWSSFGIGSGQTTTFVQPNASAIAVNRVGSASASQILGTLDANGRVVIINGNGLLFGKNAKVNVGSLIATSTDGSDSDLLAGKFTEAGSQSAAVINRGSIIAANHGVVALVAPNVSNSGLVQAKLGTVSLGGANAFTVDFKGDGLVSFATQGDVNGAASVVNTGSLIGANVAMTAHAAEGLATGVVAANGIIEAKGAHAAGGTILLDAGNGTLSTHGKIDASGKTGGGNIETSGANVSIAGKISAGKGGLWTIDPDDLTIDSGAASTIEASLNGGTNVELQTTSSGTSSPPGNVNTSGVGDINIDSALSWSTTNILTIDAYHSINILAPISITGAGELALQYNDEAADGVLSFGLGPIGFAGNISYGATNNGGTLSIDGTAYTLLYSTSDMQNIASTGKYALADSLDATGVTGWTPIGESTAFAGTFNGLGNTISNLTIDSSATHAGLFGRIGSGGTIANIGLAGGSVTDTAASADVGGLAGDNAGAITAAYATATITGGGSGSAVGGLVGASGGSVLDAYAAGTVSESVGALAGGLVGLVSAGTITNAYATGGVSGGHSSVGGLIGGNEGIITDVYATGAVSVGNEGIGGGLDGYNSGTFTDAYATGEVNGGSDSYIGGLAGENPNTITDAYATGTVTGGSGSHVGGLVGYNNRAITTAYAAGAVTGANGSTVGGLVGENDNGSTITDSYWDEDRSGTTTGIGSNAHSGGATGLSSAGSDPFQSSSYAGFGFTSTGGTQGNAWVIVDTDGTLNNAGGAAGGTLPILAFEYSTTISNAHQLQLMAMNPGAFYTLAQNIDATSTGSSTSNSTGADVWGPAGFIPVGGNNAANYTGTFNGAGHTISNLTINSSANYAGLFGRVSGTIENVGLVSGSVTDSAAAADVGGLVGYNSGSINNDYATGMVSGTAADVGGLVGYNSGSINNDYATGSVTDNAADADVGGLIGYSSGLLVGYSNDSLNNDYATGVVGGNGAGANVGGLVGVFNSYAEVTDSYATGAVTANGMGASVGGLVGNVIQGRFDADYATGAVSATGDTTFVGGLIGADNFEGIALEDNFDGDYATGTVTASGSGADVGGLVGISLSGLFYDSFATGAVTAGDTSEVGGLLGHMDGVTGGILYSYATGAVSAAGGTSLVGGLVGRWSGGSAGVMYSYATGAVSGGASSTVGGLVGVTFIGNVTYSYSTGAVSGGSGDVGGLIGFNGVANSEVSDVYATGAVSGGNDSDVGGLIGEGGADKDVYATGRVTAGSGSNVGGLVGSGAGGTDSYWDIDTTGQSSNSHGGTPMTTAELQSALPAFVNAGSWSIVAGKSYPYLCFFANCTETPQVVSGFVAKGGTAEEGVSVGLLAGGIAVEPFNAFTFSPSGTYTTGTSGYAVATTSGANGYYYFLLAPGTIANGSQVLAYIAGGSTKPGNTYAQDATGSLANFNLSEDQLTIISDAANASGVLSGLDTAIGSQTGAQYLYTQAGGFTPGNHVEIDDSAASFTVDTTLDTAGDILSIRTDGPIAETGAIDTKELSVVSLGDITLGGGNDIAELGGTTTGATGDIDFNDTVSLRIERKIDAGYGAGALTLTVGGTIKEGADGLIDAGSLTGNSTGGATLNGSNAIGTLDAFTNTGGNFALTDDGSLSIADLLGAGHDANLNVTGTISETGPGAIDATELLGSSSGGAILNGANMLAEIGAFTNTGAGGFALTDGQRLTVKGPITGGTGDADITLTSGLLKLIGDVSGDDVTLISDLGSVDQTAGSITAAGALTATGYQNVWLDSTNTYNTEILTATNGSVKGH